MFDLHATVLDHIDASGFSRICRLIGPNPLLDTNSLHVVTIQCLFDDSRDPFARSKYLDDDDGGRNVSQRISGGGFRSQSD